MDVIWKQMSNTESCLQYCGVKSRNRKEWNILCSLFVNQKYCVATNRINSFETEELVRPSAAMEYFERLISS